MIKRKLTCDLDWEWKHFIDKRIVEIRSRVHPSTVLITVARYEDHPNSYVKPHSKNEFANGYVVTFGQNNTTIWNQELITYKLTNAIEHAVGLLEMVEGVI